MPEIRRALRNALRLIGHENAELSILFTGSAGIKRLNSLHRGIDKETDVLSFPMQEFPDAASCGPQSSILGDIVISIPKAEKQADEYNTSFDEELLRLLVHGLLHLVGYDHERNRYQKLKMERKEQEVMDAVARMA